MHSEVKRRLVHVSGTVVPLVYAAGLLPWSVVRLLLLLGSAGALGLEALRLGGVVDWRIFDELTREYEQDNLAGYALYMFGMTATAWLFAPAVAVPAIMMLTVGDPVSGLLSSGDMGVKAGWVLLAMFGVCLAIASLLAVPLVPAVLGALAATLADGAKPIIAGYVIDDNLTIPVGAGAAMAVGLAMLA
ncbi:diacylglycerol/polyprenol kinase family protein [Halobacteriaceae archaeon GCM10025711]